MDTNADVVVVVAYTVRQYKVLTRHFAYVFATLGGKPYYRKAFNNDDNSMDAISTAHLIMKLYT
jgi:hypothetical protein